MSNQRHDLTKLRAKIDPVVDGKISGHFFALTRVDLGDEITWLTNYGHAVGVIDEYENGLNDLGDLHFFKGHITERHQDPKLAGSAS